MDTAGDEGAAWANQIRGAGWGQCSVFRPPQNAPGVLPEYLSLRPDEWLVVCTQSCSVCSKNFVKEPLLEVVVGSPLARFNPSHGDAQGKTSHTFHLPVSGLPGAQALSCQLGRRAFIPRHYLRDWRPERTWLSQGALDAFKGWLANYYMRIALPDELVARLRAPGGIRDTIKAALEKDTGGHKAEAGVDSFYIKWSTDEELPPTSYYEIWLVAVCRDEETKEFLDRELAALKGSPSSPLSVNGVFVSELTVDIMDNVTFTSLTGKSRFNEWDDMSPLPERLKTMRTAI